MESTVKTVVHAYHFDLRQDRENDAWRELKAKLEGIGLRCMESHGHDSYYYEFGRELDGKEVMLDTKHLFADQWNTAPVEGVSDKGLRLHDWAKDYPSDWKPYCPKHLARGYWLEQTDSMREVRRSTVKCQYCGAQEPAAKGNVFCPHCIDSEYLKEEDLRLTRMAPIDRLNDRDVPELTDAEKAHLVPLYREAQLVGSTARGRARIEKLRRGVAEKYAKKTANAKAERDGFVWLMDRGFAQMAADNVIYYDHAGKFGFGWRKPLSESEVSAVLDVISEFCWPYEIKCADGRKLEGY